MVEENHMEDDVIKISEKLVAIYINMAEEQELSNTRVDLEMALENYRKCLEVTHITNTPANKPTIVK